MDDMVLSKDQRIELTIPYPSKMPRGRGIHAITNASEGYMRFDCTKFEQQEIGKAAALAGVSRSMFLRWCAVHIAREINSVYPDDTQPTSTE